MTLINDTTPTCCGSGPGGPHGGELAAGHEQPVGGPAVDGLHVGVCFQPETNLLRPAHGGMSGGVRHQVPGGTQFHRLAAPAVRGAEQRGRGDAQGGPGQFPGPGIGDHHHLARGLHRLVPVFVEQPVADEEIPVLLVGIAVHPPEAVLLLAPQRPFGGVQAGVGEGNPQVAAVAGHGVVEPALAQQAEVGHPEFAPGRHFRRWADPPAAQQVGGQAVDRLQHGQAAQRRLNASGRGGPRRVFVVSAFTGGVSRLADSERGFALAL